ncbi:unnamed protein product [Ranitomeya imitator]|uniref:Ku C-terminal domain-containing protein n=1 Tax=Ranitomeya imitator TaxID=111125 RepID=A0ABN9KQH1_9NEOB|nr:unnamed protein product [Ranitomeya imitator]
MEHNQEPESKRMKTEDEDFSVSQVADANVTSVGSVNPTNDFRVLVRQKNANFQNLSKQLVKRIYEFLDIKQSQYYMKSMSCIKCFREEAVRISMTSPSVFEGEDGEQRFSREFWEIVSVQDGISLITSKESAGSAVTPDEAQQFLAPTEEIKEDKSVMEEGGDVDDLSDSGPGSWHYRRSDVLSASGGHRTEKYLLVELLLCPPVVARGVWLHIRTAIDLYREERSGAWSACIDHRRGEDRACPGRYCKGIDSSLFSYGEARADPGPGRRHRPYEERTGPGRRHRTIRRGEGPGPGRRHRPTERKRTALVGGIDHQNGEDSWPWSAASYIRRGEDRAWSAASTIRRGEDRALVGGIDHTERRGTPGPWLAASTIRRGEDRALVGGIDHTERRGTGPWSAASTIQERRREPGPGRRHQSYGEDRALVRAASTIRRGEDRALVGGIDHTERRETGPWSAASTILRGEERALVGGIDHTERSGPWLAAIDHTEGEERALVDTASTIRRGAGPGRPASTIRRGPGPWLAASTIRRGEDRALVGGHRPYGEGEDRALVGGIDHMERRGPAGPWSAGRRIDHTERMRIGPWSAASTIRTRERTRALVGGIDHTERRGSGPGRGIDHTERTGPGPTGLQFERMSRLLIGFLEKRAMRGRRESAARTVLRLHHQAQRFRWWRSGVRMSKVRIPVPTVKTQRAICAVIPFIAVVECTAQRKS